jgi:hypothetical protein
MTIPKNQYNLFNVYALQLDKTEYNDIYVYFIEECQTQNTNNLIINYNNKTINIIFNDMDNIMTFYIFKEDPNLYIIYEDMNPYTIDYRQTDVEKEEFNDYLDYLNINEEPFLYSFSYMN